MKKTLFFTMLAAALVGGQVFAATAIPTTLEGITYTNGNKCYGVYNDNGEANSGNVTVSYSSTGEDMSNKSVYGGGATTSASNNKVTMTGGQVNALYGAFGKTTVTGNTLIITDSKVGSAASGESTGLTEPNAVEQNVVIVAGDSELTGSLYGGNSRHGDAKDNKVYLVGKGATATIADAQGNTATYQGGTLKLNTVYAGAGEGTLANNSIDIYGTGITAYIIDEMQLLNFHIADGVLLSQEAILNLTNRMPASALDLTGVELGINADAVEDWSAFAGKSITLVNAGYAIKGLDEPVELDVMKGGQVIDKATLQLVGEGKTLQLSIPGSVPEPTTGTMSLLALAGLCMRRRK